MLTTAGVYIRQLASSLPSLQSGSPSHLHFLWIHSPERHCISLEEHLAGGVGWRPQRDGDSSDWSCRAQSQEYNVWKLFPFAIHLLSPAPAACHFLAGSLQFILTRPKRPVWRAILNSESVWCFDVVWPSGWREICGTDKHSGTESKWDSMSCFYISKGV